MTTPLSSKTVILGVTGSIAAYKAADLIRLLANAGASVYPVLTRAGAEFITPMTLQTLARNPVGYDLWNTGTDWNPEHIELADKADLLLVAPATAHCIAQFAQGLASDLLTSLHLATLAPVMIAPAMNGKMWQHPATTANVETLRKRGVHFIEPVEGMLACGYAGGGKLAAVETIANAAITLLAD
jgi:phosphopantothenoylcysteine decarboxylase